MNIFRKVSQNIFKQITLRKPMFTINHFCKIRNFMQVKTFCISNSISTLYYINNFEDDLQKAYAEAEPYKLIETMDELKKLIILTCEKYRQSLAKQIALIKQITIVVTAETWDELVQFRSLTNDLQNELNEYVILIRTLGDIVTIDENLVSFFGQQKNVDEILKKYEELEKLLLKEFEENKKMETELLKMNVNNIVSSSTA